MADESRHYRTRDIWAAGFLRSKGVTMASVEYEGNSALFVFPLSQEVVNLVTRYLAGQTIPCNPLEFANQIRSLKSAIKNTPR